LAPDAGLLSALLGRGKIAVIIATLDTPYLGPYAQTAALAFPTMQRTFIDSVIAFESVHRHFEFPFQST
jgi:hypothetical protein